MQFTSLLHRLVELIFNTAIGCIFPRKNATEHAHTHTHTHTHIYIYIGLHTYRTTYTYIHIHINYNLGPRGLSSRV